MPPPEALAKYDEVVPGAAQRILSMAEKEQTAAHDSNQFALREMAKEMKRGQWMALVVALSAFTTACILGYQGHPATAAIVGGTTVVGLVTAFIVGRRSSHP